MTGERSRGRPAGAEPKPFEPFPLPGLRAARLRAGESLAQLGRVLGVNKSHASKIELGQVRLDVERALKLARHYGIPVERFAIAEPESPAIAEPLTGWQAAAESVAKLMEAEALKRFHGISPNKRPNGYSTDSGKLEVVCSPEGVTSWQLSRPTPAGKPPLSGPIPRTQARDLIAARMESRLN